MFQFGVFSDSDLSFFSGPNFDLVGPVHTNGDLYPVRWAWQHADFSQQVSGIWQRGEHAVGQRLERSHELQWHGGYSHRQQRLQRADAPNCVAMTDDERLLLTGMAA